MQPTSTTLPILQSLSAPNISAMSQTGLGMSSEMVNFVNGLNQTVSAASKGPNGMSIYQWAQQLQVQSEQRRIAQQQAAAQAAEQQSNSLQEMFQMLMSMMESIRAQESA